MVCSIILFMGDRDALPENGQDYQVFTVAERSTENNQNEWNNGDLFSEVAEMSFDLEYATNGNSFDYNDMVLT